MCGCLKLQRLYVKAFNQLYITNKKGTSVLIVGIPSSSKAFKRRPAYNVTLIILLHLKVLLLRHNLKCCIAMCSFSDESFFM